jgi:hypothetical protein
MTRRGIVAELETRVELCLSLDRSGRIGEARDVAAKVYTRALTAIAGGCKHHRRVAFTALAVAAFVDMPHAWPKVEPVKGGSDEA